MLKEKINEQFIKKILILNKQGARFDQILKFAAGMLVKKFLVPDSSILNFKMIFVKIKNCVKIQASEQSDTTLDFSFLNVFYIDILLIFF